MALKIAGLGCAVPPLSISQRDAAELSRAFCLESEEKLRLLPALYRRTGVEKRHSVLLEAPVGEPLSRQSFYPKARHAADEGPTTRQRMQRYECEAPGLAALATERALADSGLDPGELTHLVTVSCTGFYAPGVDAALIDQLGLSRQVQRTHVGFMGCHAALNGIRVASSFVESDPAARVLVCSVELCTLHFHYGWDPQKVVANALFADGAAALVGVADDEADEESWCAGASGTLLMPGSEDAMTWTIGDHGFLMTLSPRVPELVRTNAGEWIDAWLRDNGLSIDEIGSWAVHPGGPRVLDAFAESVGLDSDATGISRLLLAEYGNMSSATLLFILERLRAENAPRPCVAVGFGPGLVIEALLLR